MHHRASLRILGSAVLFALLLSALHPQPAWADEDTPPPADPAATETAASGEPSEEVGAVPPAPAAGDPVIPPPLPPDVVPPASEASSEPALEPAPAPADLLALVPEGTSVAIVDATGAAVSLVSEQAAEILATGDPVWCPTGVAPGGAGCSISYPKLTDLVTAFTPTGSGVIWILAGVDTSAGGVTIDGNTNWSAAKAFALTLQGGWTGTGSAINTNTPSEFHTPLSIINWNAALTLNDLLITGAPGPSQALDISTTQKVTLNRVKVIGNGAGAHINNDAGSADVVVTASEFSGAATSSNGLTLSSHGAITLAGVLANLNQGCGVCLTNEGAATPKNVTLTSGTFEFNENALEGLVIYSKGAITLKDITATGNSDDGAYLTNDFPLAVGGISLTGVNIFAENEGDGLVAFSTGAITGSNLVGNVNGDWGAYLDNSSATTALPVTLTGSNEFKYSGSGLAVYSNGAITINNLTATNSTDGDGVILMNDVPTFAGDVKVTGYLTARHNYGVGVGIESNGAITLSNVSAWENGFGDADAYAGFLDNHGALSAKAITLTGANSFGYNSKGLLALSRGAITMSNLYASGNDAEDGAFLDNHYSGPASPQKVTLTGSGVFSDNPAGSGLTVSSYGAIAIANLDARNNDGSGADLDNFFGATIPQAIVLSGTNNFYDNGADGLRAVSLGAITMSNLWTGGNAGYGAYLDNDGLGAVGALSVTGTSQFQGNGDSGLEAYSRGNITVADFDSYDNDGYSLYLSNAIGSSVGSIAVGTSRANWCNGLWGNTLSGMEVYSFGAVTLSNLCAGENGDPGEVTPYGWGVLVDNHGAASAKAVSLKGSNSFGGNYSGGLSIATRGVITANHLDAYENSHGPGALISNTASGPGAPQNVTLTGSNGFNDNSGSGLELHSYGAVTLNSVNAHGNGDHGIRVDNYSGATTPKAVTINGYAGANNNAGWGLTVSSLGAIKVANLDAHGNGYGAWLDNAVGSAVGGVTITGSAYTSDNTNYALMVTSRGLIAVTLTDAWISNNGGYGWFLDNHTALTPLGITLSATAGNDIDFWDSGGYGLQVQSKGPISLINVRSSDNVGYGAYLTNNFPLAVGGISLAGSGSQFNGNGDYGLRVDSRGAITVNLPDGLQAADNASRGATLDNSFGVAPITLSAGMWPWFSNNGGDGLTVTSKGAITLADLNASGNAGAGAVVGNDLSGPGSPQNVTLSVAADFYENDLSGLVVTSYGAITLANITANDNGLSGTAGYGAKLDNYLSGYPLGAATTPKPITLSGGSSFNGNYEGGLSAVSIGAFKANDLSAGDNGGNGAYVDNQWGQGSTGGITLTGSNWFDGNEVVGLQAFSHGAITLNNLSAKWNGDDGVYLDTWGPLADQKVTLTGASVFFDNGDDGLHTGNGLEIWADGQITLSNIWADFNAENGVFLDNWNYESAGTPGVTLTGINTFLRNYFDGLYFDSKGAVSLSKVTADDNGDDGLEGYTDGNILLSCASLTNNGAYGWWLNSPALVTLKGVFAYGNAVINGYLDGGGTPFVFRLCP